MGPLIDPNFTAYNAQLVRLESEFLWLKMQEPKYFPVAQKPEIAHIEDFRTRFHPSKANLPEAAKEVAALDARIRPLHEAAEKAAEADKAAEAKKAAEQAKIAKDNESDFEWRSD